MANGDYDLETCKWPHFKSMMFIQEQIMYTTCSAVTNPEYLSGVKYENNLISEVKMEVESYDDSGNNSLNDQTDAEYDYENNYSETDVNFEYSDQNDNMSDDEHFLLSLLPMFSILSPDKNLKARIAIETALLNIVNSN